MNTLDRKVTVAALWMVAARAVDKSIGVVSTAILARLLLPTDFGLLAMALSVLRFVEIGGQLGLDAALIRNRRPSRAHYDSAWTLSVCYALFSCLALAALAAPSAAYFAEPRLEAILLTLAAVALIQGLENIGTVDFRRDFRLAREFQLALGKRLFAFSVTVVLAGALRSYWALLGGIAAGQVFGVVASYRLHPYRPRFDFTEARSLLTFSRWVVLRGFVTYFVERGPDFLIGRFLDASALGLYRSAREIATLPTTELVTPVQRAVYPAYATVAHDRAALAHHFLMTQGVVVTCALPAAVAIAILADPIVRLLLGPNWLDAIAMIEILAWYGAATIFQFTGFPVFNVLGKPQLGAALKAVEVVLLIPSVALALHWGYGVGGAAWSMVGAQVLTVPIGMAMIGRLLGVTLADRLRLVWRPLLGTAAMAQTLLLLAASPAASNAGEAALQLATALLVGPPVLVLVVLLLWSMSGMPDGPERKILALAREKLIRAR